MIDSQLGTACLAAIIILHPTSSSAIIIIIIINEGVQLAKAVFYGVFNNCFVKKKNGLILLNK